MNEIICEQTPTPQQIKIHKLKYIETDKKTDFVIDEKPKSSFLTNCKLLWLLLEESDDNLLTLKDLSNILGMDYDPQKNKGKKGGLQELKKKIITQTEVVKKTIEHYLTNNDRRVNYNYGKRQIYKLGRLYSINGLQNINSNVRGFLFNEPNWDKEDYVYADVDMKKSYYTIYIWICKMYNIDCDLVIDFINNYDKYESEYVNDYVEKIISKTDKSKYEMKNNENDKKQKNLYTDFVKKVMKSGKEDLKKLRCAMLMDFKNDSKYDYSKLNENIKKVRNEITRINNDLFRLNDFELLKNEIDNENNELGCFISHLLNSYEAIIVKKVIDHIDCDDVLVQVLIHDGFIVLIKKEKYETICKYIENYINNEFEGLNSKWVIKPFETTIQPLKNELITDNDYESKKAYWENEKFLTKIQTENLYCYKEKINNLYFGLDYTTNKVVKSKTFREDLKHLKYDYYEEKEGQIILRKDNNGGNFIIRWEQDCFINIKTEIDCIPNNTNKNIFNLWTDYPINIVMSQHNIPKDYDYFTNEEKEGVKFILDHIKETCNNEIDVYNYVLLWIGHLLIYPQYKKSLAIFLYSLEGGVGKDSLWNLIKNLIGDDKVSNADNIQKQIFGDFNSCLLGKIVINMGELSRADLVANMGRYKVLTTEPYLKINQKNIDEKEYRSFHRIIGTSNNDDPIKINYNDRRTIIIKTSNKMSNMRQNDMEEYTEYFNHYYSLIENPNVLMCFYSYLITLDPPKNISTPSFRKMATSEYMKSIISKNRDPIEDFFYEYCRLEISGKDKETDNKQRIITETELYKKFQNYLKSNNSKYEKNQKDFKHSINNMTFKIGQHIKRIVRHKQHHSLINVYDMFETFNEMYNEYENEEEEEDDEYDDLIMEQEFTENE